MIMNNQINLNNSMNMMNHMIMNNNCNLIEQYNMNNNNNINLELLNQKNYNYKPLPGMNIIFCYENKEYKESCNSKEKVKNAFRRFCKKLGVRYKKHKFLQNQKSILSGLTIGESGIEDNSKILVIYNKGVIGARDYNKNDEDDECDNESDCDCE